MTFSKLHALFFVAALTSILNATASAGIVFDFSSDPGVTTPRTTTPLSITQGGVTANFSSPDDQAAETLGGTGAFVVGPNGGLFSTLPSVVLSSGGFAYTLDVTFSQPVSAITLEFATGDFFSLAGDDLLTMNLYSGGPSGTFVGSVSSTGEIPAGSGDFYPQGTLNFSGASTFDTIVLSDFSASQGLGNGFAVAGITITTVPEPGTLTMATISVFILMACKRYQRKARH